ncbi:zf-HC2 domain-containing protein [Hoyosella sp. YIM 151337]|uniref:anti-sigma factor family protein n=1 Tax=Hoyosella sp. YIM 151337 TaxID=2992742 RepID=UPI0022364AE8|nr:zf-HC2 domain-containing protein [Hoyosella sp. YIM 151337]MCW4352926.1 zf-HC2 domain-containing protein [Hoyosella sp. YIM 151337]
MGSGDSVNLTCQTVVELITDYLEGALDTETHRKVEAHLDGCEGCTNYVSQIRSTIRALGSVRDDDLDPHMRQRLLDAFRDWRT